MNKDYTYSWITDFNEEKLASYHAKFFKRFEKNIKHFQQVNFVRKYLRSDMKWLDAPIGSGRLMAELKSKHMVGYDLSPEFIKYNRDKGLNVIEGDLFKMPFENSFDMVTCLHTLFAFDSFRDILKQLVKALRKDGILIVDIVNANHIEASEQKCGRYPYDSAMMRCQITEFFANLNCEVVEILPHDIFDNRFVHNFFWGRRIFPTKVFKRLLYEIINTLYYVFRPRKLLDKFSKRWDEKYYLKYLVAVRKKKSEM